MRLEDRHLGIVGTGLIGGSLGLALKGRAASVVGWDGDGEVLARAAARGAVDEAASSLESLVSGCDVVILAVPPRHVVETARVIHRTGGGLSALLNVAGVQARAFRSLTPLFEGRYAGFHPMAGKERGGIEQADGRLFEGAFCAVVADDRTRREVLALTRSLCGLLGADWGLLSPEEHDAAAGCVSHLPLLAATALAVTAGEAIERHPRFASLAGGGFRDTTRVASGPSWMMADVWAESDAMEELLDGLISTLQRMRGATAGEMEALASLGAARREAVLDRSRRSRS